MEQHSISLLETLPLHLLFLISECLAQLQPRTRRSIFALSLTSKTCNLATDPERFRHVHVALIGPQKLQRDIQRWRQILQAGNRLAFVRSVKITGVTVSSSVEEELIKNGDPSGTKMKLVQLENARDSFGRNVDVDEEASELFSGLDRVTNANELLPAPSTAWPDESAWKPLADLMKDFTALRDVIFTSRDQFPRLLLSALHEHHPHCRLHMHRFKLRSMILPERAELKVHPDDIALATSPCLYSIVVQTQPYHRAQIWDYNLEAVMAMTKGLAPNLKNVSLTEGVHQAAQGVFATIPRPQWKGFQVPAGKSNVTESAIGRLENLVLSHSLSGEQILEWSSCTDFSHLRSMKVGMGVSAVRKLAETSRQTPLSALSSLNLKLRPHYRFGETDEMMDPAVAELLQSLYPLEILELDGDIGEKSFEAIITHHSKRLRKLTFICGDSEAVFFEFTPERATQLSQECLNLQIVDVRGSEVRKSNGIFEWTDWESE
ncbi:unnamed protein product [Clonostachys byssicola]|uniref:F-box domain-containing protein n=1 Tax=Clonostachys byssicola TaxID=160290 RepID=A0A9N9UGC9_9HYPO|nr:unnamed protein product [Clonostachys byssicola]